MGRAVLRTTGRTRLAVLAAALAAAVVPAPTARAAVDCTVGQTYTWDGTSGDTGGPQGDGVSWDDPYNWDLDCVPGHVQRPDGSPKPQDDTAVLPLGATARLTDGQQASLARLVNRGTVVVDNGATINTRLDSTSARMVLRGLLYGTGTLTVTRSMDWMSSSDGASAQSTRRCGVDDCSTAAPAPGRTLIARGATLRVPDLGVNLDDQRVLENRGTVLLTGAGYVAADYGTTFRNLRLPGVAAPRFVMQGDGGWYQGNPTPGQPLGAFVNTGLVTKTAGTGRSVIDAAYTRTDPATSTRGTVEVSSGLETELFITTAGPGDVGEARVKQGAAFGNAGRLGPDAGDPQAVSAELTQPGTALVPVTLQELAPLAGTRGRPVRIETPGAAATSSAPLRFRLLFDRTLVRAGETPAGVAAGAPVYRRADGAASYVRLPDCTASGPTATQACVSRSRSTQETAALANGDVVLVVESLQNSRYRVG